MDKIRYAVIGLGHIAQTAVLPAFKNARENSELTALISEDPVKLEELGSLYDVEHLFATSDFDQALDSGTFDALYIATPNTDHRIFAEKAARRGIHVLCEKPLAVTEADCRALVDTVLETDVKFMVAYRLHFDGANLKAVEQARSGELGFLRFFNSIFSFQVRDPGNIRLRREKGGGPLHDIGIYCINAARSLFRDEPVEAFAFAASAGGDRRFDEVDEMISAVLRFPQERLATFTISFGAAASAQYDLVGTEGRLHLESAYEYTEGMEMTTVIDDKEKTKKFSKHDQFGPELIYFSDCILKDRQPEPSATEGLADVVVIEALLESIREGRPVAVSPVMKIDRPDEDQEIRRPAVKPPKPVNVKTPHQ